MPQASDEDRARYRAMFPDIDAGHGIKFLEGRGFRLRPDWSWDSPENHWELTDEEDFVIGFLVREWDFAGVVNPPPDPDEADRSA